MNYYKHPHEHCWHVYSGPIHMVIPNGHIVQQCCKCESTRTVHVDHAYDNQRAGQRFRRPQRW